MIAYQTDRNELVGTARVVRWRPRGQFRDLILVPLTTLGVKVRPLKARDSRIRRIPALQPGPIWTLYSISKTDAKLLLDAAASRLRVDSRAAERLAETRLRGAGFGTPENNKRVESAAVKHMVRCLRRAGWSVRDVSRENRGYDLLCKRRGREVHVEVKGATGGEQQFMLTSHEKDIWSSDTRFVLAFVGNALSSRPIISQFRGPQSQADFEFRVVSYVGMRRPNQ